MKAISMTITGLLILLSMGGQGIIAQSLRPSVPVEHYRWKSVQIVGGGFVDGIVFHPKEKDVRYCRTDMGGPIVGIRKRNSGFLCLTGSLMTITIWSVWRVLRSIPMILKPFIFHAEPIPAVRTGLSFVQMTEDGLLPVPTCLLPWEEMKMAAVMANA